MICFASFGFYCQYRPFLLSHVDKLKIASEVSIFSTLLSSIVLRADPNNAAVGLILSVLYFAPPVLAIYMRIKAAQALRYTQTGFVPRVVSYCKAVMAPKPKPPQPSPNVMKV